MSKDGTIVCDSTGVDTEFDILTELGLVVCEESDKEYNLILWNDHVNDMVVVIVALMSVCKLSKEDAYNTMMAAHTNGKAFIKSGDLKTLQDMKKGLNEFQIEATIES